MNVRDNSSKERKPLNIDLASLIFGGGKPSDHRHDKDLRMFVIGSTIILWLLAALISIGVFYFGNDMIFGKTLINGLLIASLLGIGSALLSVIGKSDWNSTYGNGLFARSLGYNIVLFLIVMTVDIGVGKELREPVKEFKFLVTDVKNCQYKISMVSENLTYDYCSDYSSEYKELESSQEISAVLVGKNQYGANKADYVEFIKKQIVKK